jgi:preprotein translocase subunit SecG
MIYLVYAIHVIVCLFLIMVVLLQQGKGADLSVFGGGATQAAFGARGAASLLHKLTVWGFVAFIVTTISIGFMISSDSGGSVLSDVPVETAPSAPAPSDPAAIPAGDTEPATEDPAAGESEAVTDDEAADPASEGGETESNDDAGDQ